MLPSNPGHRKPQFRLCSRAANQSPVYLILPAILDDLVLRVLQNVSLGHKGVGVAGGVHSWEMSSTGALSWLPGFLPL